MSTGSGGEVDPATPGSTPAASETVADSDRRSHHEHDASLADTIDEVLPVGPEPLDADELRREPPRIVNVPNAVTFLRALLVPVILWLLAIGDERSRWWAFGIFLFAALTDSIDGWVARRWHGVTAWGQLADPIADKLLIIGSLASLASVGELPWWAVWVIVAREIGVTVMRVGLVRRRSLVLPASVWGKVKTVLQVLAVLLYLMPGVEPALRTASLWVAVVATVASGLDYARHVQRLVRTAKATA